MPENNRLLYALGLILLILLAVTTVQAGRSTQQPAPQQGQRQVPLSTAITYQGRLLFDGAVISDTCAFRFNLYEDAGGTSLVGTPLSLTGIPVHEGYFTVQLDFGSGVFDGNARWLEVRVRCPGDADYTGLGLQEITAAPYALYALNVATHDHWGESWSGSGTGLTLSNGDIGLSVSGRDYGVRAETHSADGTSLYGYTTSTSGSTYGVHGQTDSPDGRAVYGQATGTSGFSYGVYGQSASSGGRAVFGLVTASSGVNCGVCGQTNSNSGDGIYGWASSTSGTTYGVRGISTSTAGRGVYGWTPAGNGTTYGVYGQAESSSGYGVYGRTTSDEGTTYGVHGESASSDGYGIHGVASATSGTTYGVYGESNSNEGYGIHGYNSSVIGYTYGVYGETASLHGHGVHGHATATSGDNYGVYGQADGHIGSYGVYGYASNTSGLTYGVSGVTESAGGYGVYGVNYGGGYAAWFAGNTHVNGTLSKSAGSFKIDHPLDPANQYLYHSFVESPDMKNIYDGVVMLDESGAAWVDLPDWFEALNTDFRYQLTAIGAPAPDLYIAQKVMDNRFQIAGGPPGIEISWQITGIRHDPYAEAHRIPVEEDKPADEIGTYLYPELYGQPEEFGLEYRHMPDRQIER